MCYIRIISMQYLYNFSVIGYRFCAWVMFDMWTSKFLISVSSSKIWIFWIWHFRVLHFNREFWNMIEVPLHFNTVSHMQYLVRLGIRYGDLHSITTSNVEKKIRNMDIKKLLWIIFSWKWRQLTTERLLSSGPPIGRISTIWNQRVLRTVGEERYYSHKQRPNDSILQRSEPFLRNLVQFVVTADLHTHYCYTSTRINQYEIPSEQFLRRVDRQISPLSVHFNAETWNEECGVITD
jgi:hypothetical protein